MYNFCSTHSQRLGIHLQVQSVGPITTPPQQETKPNKDGEYSVEIFR